MANIQAVLNANRRLHDKLEALAKPPVWTALTAAQPR